MLQNEQAHFLKEAQQHAGSGDTWGQSREYAMYIWIYIHQMAIFDLQYVLI